jgi:hypothetical protein
MQLEDIDTHYSNHIRIQKYLGKEIALEEVNKIIQEMFETSIGGTN